MSLAVQKHLTGEKWNDFKCLTNDYRLLTAKKNSYFVHNLSNISVHDKSVGRATLLTFSVDVWNFIGQKI